MKNEFDAIDNALEVSAEIVSKKEIEKKPTRTSIKQSKGDAPEIQRDYEYSRAQLYSLIDKGAEAVNGALEVAQESGHPRAFEVFGQLLKNTTEVNDRLLELQIKMEQMKALERKGNPTKITNNALFVGSTAELQKLIKGKNKEDELGED